MATTPLRTVLRLLRRAAGGEVGPTDGQLLERYLATRDEEAFELLVWRHGPMVLGVCRRLLGDVHDAEDAFQATFLTLVRKAATIGKRESLGSWLHRVASRVALRAREQALRLPRVAGDGFDVPAPEAVPAVVWRDLRLVLDEEVGRLPERERAPVVLCYLEGKTNAEAARQLGCPRGTVAIRLKRARDRLRGRLLRRGLALSAGAVVALTKKASAALVPAALVRVTLRAAVVWSRGKAAAGAVSAPAAVLAEGVLRAMFLNKLKSMTAVVLAAGVLLIGAGAILWKGAGSAGARPTAPGRAAREYDPAAADVASERDGVLLFVGTDVKAGEKVPPGLSIKVKVEGVTKTYRRLRVGDMVEEGQLLARVDDRLARDEVAIKQAKVAAAEAEQRAVKLTKEAAAKRCADMRRAKGAFTEEDLRQAELARDRYTAEEKAAAAKVRQAQAEVAAARTVVEMHEIRSPFRGVVRAIYRRRGEAVRAFEPVLRVRVEVRKARPAAPGKDRIDLPSEAEGRLIFLGVELTPAEAKQVADLRRAGKSLPARYVEAELGFLAVEVPEGKKIPADQMVKLPGVTKVYRRWRPGDELIPGQVVVAREKKMFRKLAVGDEVKEGQLLGLVNPVLALDDLAVKNASLQAAQADFRASEKTRDEVYRLYMVKERTRRDVGTPISNAELQEAKLSWQRYTEESRAKNQAIRKAQRELSASMTKLKMHEIRAAVPGMVTKIYRRRGEAVRRLEAVIQVEER